MYEKIDLSKVEDRYCPICKTKKRKYIGHILAAEAVLFEDLCDCNNSSESFKSYKSDKTKFDEFQVPWWKLMGQKPKEKDIKLDKYLKSRGMTYGDYRRERDYHQARNQSGLAEYNEHLKRYGRNDAPNIDYEKKNQES